MIRNKTIIVSRKGWDLINYRSGLIRMLKKQGWDVIGAGGAGSVESKVYSALGIKFFNLPIAKHSESAIADLKLFITLYKIYKLEKPKMVQHFTIKPVIYGSLAAKLARVPNIYNFLSGRGYAFSEFAPKWLTIIVKSMLRIALKSTNFLFLFNQFDRKYCIDNHIIASQKSAVIRGCGIDIQYFSPRKSPLNDHPIVLMISRILIDKGVYEFAQAAQYVRAVFPKTEFWLLGDRDEFNPMVVPKNDFEKILLKKEIRLLGKAKDVRPIIAQADIVALPTYYLEGLPHSLLEGAAMEKPLVTTSIPGCEDIVDNNVNGFLVPPRNSLELARAIIKLIADPKLREKMGKNGRKKVVLEFDEKIVLDKIIKTYHKYFN